MFSITQTVIHYNKTTILRNVLRPSYVTMAGDFILSLASIMIARLRNDDVTILCSKMSTSIAYLAGLSVRKMYKITDNNSTIGGSNNNKSNNEINNNHNNYSKLNVNTKRKCCSNTKTNSRHYSSAHTQQPAGPIREMQIDPYIILEEDLKDVYDDIRERLFVGTTQPELKEIASYYFDGQGKAFRPMVVFLMAKAINYHLNKESSALLNKQRKLALFAEMAHSASLVHDDVIDQSNYRRGKPSVNVLWNHKKIKL
uniref:Polyprenyl synthetase n=1 Tax=Glossina brevipalpis TaxID=37001 RepID=A0A1A9WRQ1_9MUSC